MIKKLKLLKEHQGFMKYFKNTSNPEGTMVKIMDHFKFNTLGWKYTMDLEEKIRKIYEWYLEKKI